MLLKCGLAILTLGGTSFLIPHLGSEFMPELEEGKVGLAASIVDYKFIH